MPLPVSQALIYMHISPDMWFQCCLIMNKSMLIIKVPNLTTSQPNTACNILYLYRKSPTVVSISWTKGLLIQQKSGIESCEMVSFSPQNVRTSALWKILLEKWQHTNFIINKCRKSQNLLKSFKRVQFLFHSRPVCDLLTLQSAQSQSFPVCSVTVRQQIPPTFCPQWTGMSVLISAFRKSSSVP